MHTRIELIVKESGLTKAKFAEKLGVSAPYVTMLCSGAGNPSDRTISDICRVFNVNRRYLEHGEEPMFMPDPDMDTEYINTLLAASDSPFVDAIRAVLDVYVKLPADSRKKVDEFIADVRQNLADKDRD